jgi:hypothetical protein
MNVLNKQTKVRGQGVVEYALLLGLVAIISVFGLYLLGNRLTQSMEPLPELASSADIEPIEESACKNPNTIQGANLIQNGSFEEPPLQNRSWRLFTQIEGWTATHRIEIQNNVAGSPHSGSAFTELDTNRSTVISQVVDTIADCTYTLEFAFSARPRTRVVDNALIIMWNGVTVDTLVKYSSKQTNWQTYVYQLTATSKQSTLEFKDGGVSNGVGTYLDTVSLYLDS